MADEGQVKIVERSAGKEEEGKGGFFDTVKGFVQDVGEAIGSAFSFGKPDADVSAIHLPHIDMDMADVVIDLLITNPNPVPIPLVDIEYLIESEGRQLLSGTIPDAGTIHAHGSEMVKIPVRIIYKDIVDTFEDINPGQVVGYLLKVVLHIDVPVIGRISIPLEKKGEIPIPEKPDVDIEKVEWDHFSFEETTATLHLKVENANPFDLGINRLAYEVHFGDVEIGKAHLAESTVVGHTKCVGEKGIGRLVVPITFRPKDFGSALWDIIRRRSTGYTMKGHVEVDTPFGPMKLPFIKEGGKTKLAGKDDKD